MIKKMLINVMHPEEARAAIVEDGKLVELDIEMAGREQTRGNVYKGVVVRVEPGLQAAFIDIGTKKLAFLQMGELHPNNWQWRDDIPADQRSKRPRIQEVLRRGQELLVQVEKGERDTKGAAVTTYMSFPGRYFVLMPDSDSSGISRKVEDNDERKKLRQLVTELEVPESMGYIIRTEAVGHERDELIHDFTALMERYRQITTKAKGIKAPALVYEDLGLVPRMLRDYYNTDIDEVIVDSAEAVEEARAFFRDTMPALEKIVKLHQERRPIFSRFQLEEQIDLIYEKKVPLKSGGSIVIEQTEALVSIDVNSGKSTGEKGIEETAFRINQEAAEEAARQLRLRDLGGLIVIDFIDMRDKKHRQAVEKCLKDALKQDKARTSVERISTFGLLEMSRQRIKPAIETTSYSECPHCTGRGKLKTVEAMALSFLRKVHAAAARGSVAEVHGGLPLEVAYFLLNRKKRELTQIENDYDIQVTVKGKPSFLMNQLELDLVKREKLEEQEPPERKEPRPAPQKESEAEEAETASEPKKRKRKRRKKKGGDGEQLSAEQADTTITDHEESEQQENEVSSSTESDRKKKRRRRRRKKKPGEGESAPATEVTIGAEAPVASVAVGAPITEKPAPKKRPSRSPRKPKEKASDAPEAPETPTAAPAEPAAKPKRGRRPKAENEVTPAPVATEESVAPPKKRRASRPKKESSGATEA